MGPYMTATAWNALAPEHIYELCHARHLPCATKAEGVKELARWSKYGYTFSRKELNAMFLKDGIYVICKDQGVVFGGTKENGINNLMSHWRKKKHSCADRTKPAPRAAKAARPHVRKVGRAAPTKQRQSVPEDWRVIDHWAFTITGNTQLRCMKHVGGGLTVKRWGVPTTRRDNKGVCCVYIVAPDGTHYLGMLGKDKLNGIDMTVGHGRNIMEATSHMKTANWVMEQLGIEQVW
jgi:hypothetical protein